MHMAWSLVVHKYLHKQTRWFLTSFGRLTMRDAKVPRHAAMSGGLRVVALCERVRSNRKMRYNDRAVGYIQRHVDKVALLH